MDDPPATRQPAPRALALVQDFVNTAELPGGYDELGDVPATVEWLGARGYQVPPDEPQRRRIVETREHLRSLIAVNSGQELPPASAARLSRLLDAAAVHPVVSADGVRLASTALGVDGFLAALLAALVQGTIDGTFARLKVCRSDTCQWTFYDNSKNGCGAWCTMRSCGARAKAKAYRERQRVDARADAAQPGAVDAATPPRRGGPKLLRLPA
ncbi:MAG: CGNR zinc finger domain-containing protein [Candidatus Dormibacteraeota bacterium]|uniref:CGNR zinc finger domain-containing protein n=1 Tax=Candidatus Aeolococcus gillhamiae TaxID=3127015 RepID=A0A934N6B3_9BACT|nr:CGNR zinc finger domain-containing protein [Candidatus Dormibacteraeota bacterium]